MAGTWQALGKQPSFSASTMLLLTDGTVLAQAVNSKNWWKLTPDATGSYVSASATWTALANSAHSRMYYASAVLNDGRVFVAGGEYSDAGSDLDAAEIYNPQTNTWTTIPTPGWGHIGDAPCCVLPNGNVLMGYINDARTSIYNPTTNAWTAGPNKNNASSSEETWTLTPDQTVLTVNCNGNPTTEKYVIASNTWVNTGNTPHDLVEASSIEIGPAILLPNGHVFAIGATGYTALYTPGSVSSAAGTWANGPQFPTSGGQQLIAKDAPAALLPNGKVLCSVGPVGPCAAANQGYCPGVFFYEYNSATNTLTAAPNPANNNANSVNYNGRLLLLPTGQVLYSNATSNIQVYTPDLSPNAAWKPSITSVAGNLNPGHTYTLTGLQLNGLSQACSYGDDATMATNYPLVRIVNNATGHVVYCRTHTFSTLGVHTGTVSQTTQFDVPSGIGLGASMLCVVANGISSTCTAVTVSQVIKNPKELHKDIVKEIEKIHKDIEKINVKQEIDVVKIPDKTIGSEVKTGGQEGGIVQQGGGDPAFESALHMLAQRVDELSAQTQQQAFIPPQERPEVGVSAGATDGTPTPIVQAQPSGETGGVGEAAPNVPPSGGGNRASKAKKAK